jgi:hypothetical protein
VKWVSSTRMSHLTLNWVKKLFVINHISLFFPCSAPAALSVHVKNSWKLSFSCRHFPHS